MLCMQVDLICGTTNALINVAEPEKCTYLFQVSTPAVCIVKGDLPVSSSLRCPSQVASLSRCDSQTGETASEPVKDEL